MCIKSVDLDLELHCMEIDAKTCANHSIFTLKMFTIYMERVFKMSRCS